MTKPTPTTKVTDAQGRELIVKVEALQKYFGKNHVLKGVDVEIYKGEVVVLIGPSGSGKSTFLRCLNFLEDPTTGEITIGGVHVKCGSHGGAFKKAFGKKGEVDPVMHLLGTAAGTAAPSRRPCTRCA